MKQGIASLLVGLAFTGPGTAAAETTLPWSALSDLESKVTQTYAVTGCGDARPMEMDVIDDRGVTYQLVVNADIRWAMIGPTDSRGATPIWYGAVSGGDRLVLEGSLMIRRTGLARGTFEADVCPLLTREGVLVPRASPRPE